MIRMLFDAYSLLVLVAVILSWTRAAPDNPIRKITDATVEPVLEPIRRVIPPIAGLLLLVHFARFCKKHTLPLVAKELEETELKRRYRQQKR